MSEVNKEAFEAYMKLSQEIEDSLISEMGQEAYDASQHWVNNPLISPISKMHNFEEHEKWVRKDQTERIINLLEDIVKKYGLSDEGYTNSLITRIKEELE